MILFSDPYKGHSYRGFVPIGPVLQRRC